MLVLEKMLHLSIFTMFMIWKASENVCYTFLYRWRFFCKFIAKTIEKMQKIPCNNYQDICTLTYIFLQRRNVVWDASLNNDYNNVTIIMCSCCSVRHWEAYPRPFLWGLRPCLAHGPGIGICLNQKVKIWKKSWKICDWE